MFLICFTFAKVTCQTMKITAFSLMIGHLCDILMSLDKEGKYINLDP